VGIGGGGPIGRVLGFRGQVTYERVEDKGFGKDTRLAVAGVLGPPSVEIARGVQLFLRGDGITRFGGSDIYTWSRASAGLSLLPIPQVRLSSAYYQSWEWGTPRFPYDRVSRDHGVTARVDLTVGATRVGYMNQYSSRRSGWVRGQVYLARRIGITEPFVAYDEQFNRVSLGVNLDTTALLDRLFRRRVTGVETPSR
jgi:hypothetical protein